MNAYWLRKKEGELEAVEVPWLEGEELCLWCGDLHAEVDERFFERHVVVRTGGRVLRLLLSRDGFQELARAVLAAAGIRDRRLCPRCGGVMVPEPAIDGYDAVHHVWACTGCDHRGEEVEHALA